MVEHRNIDSYLEESAQHDAEEKPFLALFSLHDAFKMVSQLEEDALFALHATDIWNAANDIEQREKGRDSESVITSAQRLKTIISTQVKERGVQIVLPAI